MATTPNYGWVMPDPTDFVTDLPADFEIFGDAVDATVDGIETVANAAIPETLIDAAGDLIYGSAADTVARLGIGTAGQVLTVNSGATAPEWADASGGGGAYTLINTGGTALTGAATITVSGISGYDTLFIYVQGASTISSSSPIYIQFNTTSNNHRWYAGQYTGASSYGATIIDRSFSTNGSEIPFATMSNSATSSVGGFMKVEGAATTAVKPLWFASGVDGNNTGHKNFVGGGDFNAAAAISSVSILSIANFDAGTLYVYGR
jgi:hypothetical protein